MKLEHWNFNPPAYYLYFYTYHHKNVFHPIIVYLVAIWAIPSWGTYFQSEAGSSIAFTERNGVTLGHGKSLLFCLLDSMCANLALVAFSSDRDSSSSHRYTAMADDLSQRFIEGWAEWNWEFLFWLKEGNRMSGDLTILSWLTCRAYSITTNEWTIDPVVHTYAPAVVCGTAGLYSSRAPVLALAEVLLD